MGAVQQSYSINPNAGFPGTIAEPESPHRVESGILRVPSGGTNPQPGVSLRYDTGNDAWAVPTSSGESVRSTAILTYRHDEVANSGDVVQYVDGDEIEIVTMGVVWLAAGNALEYYQQVQWDRSSPFRWGTFTRAPGVVNMHENPVYSLNREAVVDGAVFKAAIGYGRII